MVAPWEEMVLRSWSESAGSVMASSYYHVSGKTQMQIMSKQQTFINRTGSKQNDRSRTEVSNPKGTEGQAVSGQGRQKSLIQGGVTRYRKGRQAQGQGR